MILTIKFIDWLVAEFKSENGIDIKDPMALAFERSC